MRKMRASKKRKLKRIGEMKRLHRKAKRLKRLSLRLKRSEEKERSKRRNKNWRARRKLGEGTIMSWKPLMGLQKFLSGGRKAKKLFDVTDKS